MTTIQERLAAWKLRDKRKVKPKELSAQDLEALNWGLSKIAGIEIGQALSEAADREHSERLNEVNEGIPRLFFRKKNK